MLKTAALLLMALVSAKAFQKSLLTSAPPPRHAQWTIAIRSSTITTQQLPWSQNQGQRLSTCLYQAILRPSSSGSKNSRRRNEERNLLDLLPVSVTTQILPLVRFALHSFLVALLIISWEDVTCHETLPSRHRTTYLADAAAAKQWGRATIKGMGFGRDERLLLLEGAAAATTDPLLQSLPSYNEVMLYHRTVRVPQWKQDVQRAASNRQFSASYYASAIETLCQCLASVWELQDLARNYQWEALQSRLQTAECWTQFEWAASRLRPVNAAVGFDWGSCAWRPSNSNDGSGAVACNALADAQEALDELNFLTGVLEPYEALFCLDIVERSLRDILVVVPWHEMKEGSADLVAFWQRVPPYQPHRVFDPEAEQVEGVAESETIDDEYVQALQSLRIE